MGIHPTRDIFTKRYPLRKDIHAKRISTSHEYSFRKYIPPHGLTCRMGIGLVFPASSAGVFSGVKKGRLFERSEFLPFSRREHRSSRKNAALILSFWFFFFRIKTKEKERVRARKELRKNIRNSFLFSSRIPILFITFAANL